MSSLHAVVVRCTDVPYVPVLVVVCGGGPKALGFTRLPTVVVPSTVVHLVTVVLALVRVVRRVLVSLACLFCWAFLALALFVSARSLW